MIGIPYARAGVITSEAGETICTATCPECGNVSRRYTSKGAAAAHADHWAAEHQHQEEE